MAAHGRRRVRHRLRRHPVRLAGPRMDGEKMNGFPLQYLVGGLVVVSLAGGLYGLGHRAGVDACRADLAGHLSRAAEQARQIALQDAEVSAQAAQVIHAIRTVEKRVEVEVINEVPAE